MAASSNPTHNMPPDLEQKVLVLISQATRTPGKTISRRRLIYDVFRHVIPENELANSAEDRQIRKAIENLRLRGQPIISSSASKGYSLLTDKHEIEKMITEMESRRESLADQIRSLRNTYGLAPRALAPIVRQPSLLP